MIERRIVSTQLINLSHTNPNRLLVTHLTRLLQQDGGPQGIVFLLPRKQPMDRYRPVANSEVVHAALLAGEEAVQALIGEWPTDIPDLLPIEGLLTASSIERRPISPSAAAPTDPTELEPLDRARHYAEQVKIYGSQDKAAFNLGVPRSTINNAVQLLKLIPEVQTALKQGCVGESAARTMALADAKHQLRLLDWYVGSDPKPTIRELEQAIRFIGQNDGDFRTGKKLGQQFASVLSEAFGCEIVFRNTGRGGWCKVKVSDLESPIAAGILANSKLRHKTKFVKEGGGAELTFKYADNDDLMSVLPKMERVD